MHPAERGRLARLRYWLRPPRRLRLLRPGGLLIGGIFGLGFATLNTGNNLLYLLLGALLGLIAVSGLLSEQALRGVLVRRHVPGAPTAGEATAIRYEVGNTKRRMPSYVLTVRERTGESAFVMTVPAGGVVHVRAAITFPTRGVVTLEDIVLSTTFPFGLFIKERDLPARDGLLVRPRVTRPVRALRPAGRDGATLPVAPLHAAGGERGEFRGLRPYRSGDDPRDVHWLSSARTGTPIVREYDREQGRSYLLYLDTSSPAGARSEVAVEIAAALAAAAVRREDHFGLIAGREIVSQGSGPAQLDRVLDALARVTFPSHSRAAADPAECMWIGTGSPPAGYADAFVAGVDG